MRRFTTLSDWKRRVLPRASASGQLTAHCLLTRFIYEFQDCPLVSRFFLRVSFSGDCVETSTTTSDSGNAQQVQSNVKPTIYAEEGIAIKGYDPVADFTNSKAVKGMSEFSYDWRGTTWHFASAENREHSPTNQKNMRLNSVAITHGPLRKEPPHRSNRHLGKLSRVNSISTSTLKFRHGGSRMCRAILPKLTKTGRLY